MASINVQTILTLEQHRLTTEQNKLMQELKSHIAIILNTLQELSLHNKEPQIASNCAKLLSEAMDRAEKLTNSGVDIILINIEFAPISTLLDKLNME